MEKRWALVQHRDKNRLQGGFNSCLQLPNGEVTEKMQPVFSEACTAKGGEGMVGRAAARVIPTGR